MSVGHEIVGAVLSTADTVKAQVLVLVASSVAVKVTVVTVPIEMPVAGTGS